MNTVDGATIQHYIVEKTDAYKMFKNTNTQSINIKIK